MKPWRRCGKYWASAAGSALTVAQVVLWILWGFRDADADGIEKFGDAYRDYMRRVAGWNPVAGVWRRVRRRNW